MIRHLRHLRYLPYLRHVRRLASLVGARRKKLGMAAMLLALAGTSLMYSLCGCQPKPGAGPLEPVGPMVNTLGGEPSVRVRIVRQGQRVDVGGSGSVEVGPFPQPPDPSASNAPRRLATPLTVISQTDGFIIRSAGVADAQGPAAGQAIRWALQAMYIRPLATQPITINGASYPGSFVLYPVNAPTGAAERIDVINHVPLEQYLPGVISRELYAKWHPQAFRAQAIAARSYAIVQRSGNSRRPYDLESTEASQVYGGTTANTRALEAVAATRGVVLTWEGSILPAYFSSSCGGTGQDAAIAFPNARDIPPLRGRRHGGWCAASSTYRWGPIVRGRATLSARLAEWGKGRNHPIAALQMLQSITVAATNSAGRPARFTLTDTAGHSFDLKAEEFRVACNYEAPGLAGLTADGRLKSSHVTVHVINEAVQFVDGRGFGHGVGLCQWGAQAIAQKGYNAPSILAFYYPGAKLQRAY